MSRIVWYGYDTMEAVRAEKARRADRPGSLLAGYSGDERETMRQQRIDDARRLG
ncbi:hypothetical protein [Candidatus Palauibacter sp.]|uniref:hypothetical protein n=1 Tax=Candidatus Palauibacter sp. TaxID=3101350 RepID=UPI003B59AE7C